MIITPTQELTQQLASYQTLVANIRQVTETQSGQALKSSGKLWIQRPDRFKYEISQPNEQLYVSDGKQLWNYEKALLQVVVHPLGQQIDQTPMLLLSGKVKNIGQLFTVKALSASSFILTPKDQDSLIAKIQLSFDHQKPETMVLTNPFGQITTIRFNQVKLNQKLSKALFQFKPPKGVDVLSQ